MLLNNSELNSVRSTINCSADCASTTGQPNCDLVNIMNKLHNSNCDQSSSYSQSDSLDNSQERDSIPIILNTPDSGIIQSQNSLDAEMASSNLGSTHEQTNNDSALNNDLTNGQLDNQLNNDLNSNHQLRDPIGHLIKNGKMDYDDKVHFDFLTASQLQKIVSIRSRLFVKRRFILIHTFSFKPDRPL